jgi:hypothetical protein
MLVSCRRPISPLAWFPVCRLLLLLQLLPLLIVLLLQLLRLLLVLLLQLLSRRVIRPQFIQLHVLLDEAGKFLEQNKFRLAVIAASVEIGDTEKDRVLTQARAKVVRDYLVQHFKFDDTRVKIIGLGKSPKPDETNKVEILIYR